MEKVAPFAGAWIEISSVTPLPARTIVAPFAGAWIEIALFAVSCAAVTSSLPSRERGLKLRQTLHILQKAGRSLRGSVD